MSGAALAAYGRMLLRPWKLVTFVLGTAFFVWGAYFWAVPTWDVGVSRSYDGSLRDFLGEVRRAASWSA